MSCYKLDGQKVIAFDSLEDMTEKDLETQTLIYTKLNIFKNSAEVSTIFNPLGYNLDDKNPLVFETIIKSNDKDVKENLDSFHARNSFILKAIDSHHDAISFASGVLLGNNIKKNEENKK